MSALVAKEVALTFDDAPMPDSKYFSSAERTRTLIAKLKKLGIPRAMIFANPCKGNPREALTQLALYKDAGHLIANHTCHHLRLDDVGAKEFIKDAELAEGHLKNLFSGQKYFRFPYLHEGKTTPLRDEIRTWMQKNDYRNGMVSIDNDDYIFSFKINQAKEKGLKVDDVRVKKLFMNHLTGAVDFYDELAVKTLGRSPKHVLLLHEMDATVLYLEDLVAELRKRGWTIIGADEAFADPLYKEKPKNTYANNGIIAQMAFEKTGKKEAYDTFNQVKAALNSILKIK